MRHDAQFDLRVVGGHNQTACGRGKGAAHAAAFGCADGDVLQVGIAAGEPAGDGDGLGIGGVYAAGARVDHFGQLVGVGGFEFGQAAVFQDDFGQGVVGRKLFEHGFVGGDAAGCGFFQPFGGDAHFVEQDFLQLLGRIEIKRLSGRLKRLLFEF